MRLIAVLLALCASTAPAGTLWTPLTPSGARMGSAVLAVDPFDPDTLYADAFDVKSMGKSTDGGKTWTVLPFHADLLRRIIVGPSDPNRITAMAWDAPDFSFYRSTDGGTTWSGRHVTPAVIGVASDVAVDPLAPDTLYISHWVSCWGTCIPGSGGVSRTTDGGRTWAAVLKGTNVDHLLVDPLGGRRVYAVASSTKYTDNAGFTWSSLVTPAPVQSLALDPVVPGVLYLSTSPGDFWRSDDSGATWSHLGVTFSRWGSAAWTIAVNPANRDVIVACGSSGLGVERSTDGGRTWQPLNDGLAIPEHPEQLAFIQVMYAADGTLYGAATWLGAMTVTATPTARRRAVRR